MCSWITYSEHCVTGKISSGLTNIHTSLLSQKLTMSKWKYHSFALFLKEEYFYFHKWCTILIKMAQKYSLPVTPSLPPTPRHPLPAIPPPPFFICIPVPWIQYFRYIFHSVTSWFKMFAQDNSEPCQIHVTYFIFQVNCRLSFMNCSSKYSDMQEVVPVNSVPCH